MFKNEFKYYKRRSPNPDYEYVVDFNQMSNANKHGIEKIEGSTMSVIEAMDVLNNTIELHFLPLSVFNWILFKELPTWEQVEETVVYFMDKPFQVKRRQPEGPSTKKVCCHHNTLGLINTSSWNIYEFIEKPGLLFIVNPFTSKGQQYWVERCLQEFTKKPNRLNLDPFNELGPGEDWWQATQSNDHERAHKLLLKLRWATLGYHHNWDTKKYNEMARNEFPPDLAQMSKFVMDTLYGPAALSYQAEAAIVNFYHFDSTLSGHKDVSEPNMDSPLLSVSFGQSAVFLVGGESMDDTVTPMLLHSGDIVVMSGQARRCYHGVPKVVPAPSKPWSGDLWETTPCGRYLNSSRINMNIRQVLLPGQLSVKYEK